MIQRRFGLSSRRGEASICCGIMDRVSRSPPVTLPFLTLGARRHIFFPESGKAIPFTCENYPFLDPFGRESVTWIRTFRFPKRVRRFDACMIFSEQRQCIVDYLGTHHHLAVDLALSVTRCGGLHIRSGQQRVYERFLGFSLPGPLAGTADVTEWFDERLGLFRIRVAVANPLLGLIFGYEGRFRATWIPGEEVPRDLLPKRFERRE
jgi:hypothetical protein